MGESRRLDLTPAQAQLLAEIETRRRAAQKEWAMAVTLVGVDPRAITGGNLADDPHLMVREADAVSP